MSEKQKNSNDIRKRCNSFRFFGILSMFVKKNSQHKIMTYTVHGSYEKNKTHNKVKQKEMVMRWRCRQMERVERAKREKKKNWIWRRWLAMNETTTHIYKQNSRFIDIDLLLGNIQHWTCGRFMFYLRFSSSFYRFKASSPIHPANLIRLQYDINIKPKKLKKKINYLA